MGNYSITTFEKRQIIMAHRPTIKALTRGLGKKVFGRWWNVSLSNSSKAYVEYFHNGENRRIFGFKGFRRVYSLISEENNQLTAYFYKNELNAESKKGLIKIAVLSKSKVSDNGLKNIWVPLEKPEVIFSRKKMQIQKMTIKNIKEFLTADMPEGTVFEIAPRRVDLRGRITFGIDSAKEGIITFYGYSEYAGKRLPGEIIVEGNGEKKCFFWPNYKAIDEKSGPIIPEGHVIAQRKGDGTWKILWQSISELEKRKNATRKYGNYIFASVGDKIHSEYWPVQVKNMDGKKWRGIFL
ncbi:MAG: hypothetical protein NT030_06305, partial [Candidatus Saganbacteria bacterium]|nr:hypothetical protein [Candidatus Saganbacteria bacterium]